MNNKEFIAELAERVALSQKDAAKFATQLVSEMASHLEDEDVIAIAGFGVFEVRKKLERVVVNPGTKQRMLVPPKLVINYKPATTLKDKANGK